MTSLEAENKKLKFDMSRLKVDAMELAQVIVDLRSEMQDKAAAAVIQELPTKGDQDRIDVPPISAEAATEKEAPVDVPEEPEAKDARDSLNYLAEMLFPELHSPKQIEGVGDHQIEVDEIEDDIPPKEDDPSLSPVL